MSNAGFPVSDRRLDQLTWAFVGLGVSLRVGRYAMNFPIWWDESFVAVNFLRRGYLGLLRPLDYGQVCPLLFLWIELTAVKVLGFSEWSLRIFPLVCGVTSVFLFRHAAGRVLSGMPRLLATAIFAVSFYPIRHSVDVKPYASDLLAALVLLSLAFEWLHDRRTAWLAALAAAGPVAVALSHPAAFVAGGVVLALAPSAWRTGRLGARAALAGFGLATVGTFVALFVLFTRAQAGATLPAMSAEWSGSFPPLDGPWKLARWLVLTHTGNIFAYPFGSARWASTLSFGLAAIATIVLWKRGDKSILAVCVSPFALGLVAAALRRYPYGGSAHGGSTRFMQYLAPSICLLAGLGGATAWRGLPRPRRGRRLLALGLVGLAAVGIVPLLSDLAHPYRSIQAERSREFARKFWPRLAREGEVACLRWDLGFGSWDSIHLNRPVALCNQAIYSPSRREDRGPRPAAITAGRPLVCVLCDARSDEERALSAWLGSMRRRFALKRSESIIVVGDPRGDREGERYLVFEFVPRF